MGSRVITVKIGDQVYTEAIDGNLELSELTPEQIMEGLNRAVGKYAFYGSLRADAKRLAARLEIDNKMWKSLKLREVRNMAEFKKATVSAIEAERDVLYERETREWGRKITQINAITDKLYVLMQAFEIMTKTLQSILAMRRAELGQLEGTGEYYRKGTGDMIDD